MSCVELFEKSGVAGYPTVLATRAGPECASKYSLATHLTSTLTGVWVITESCYDLGGMRSGRHRHI